MSGREGAAVCRQPRGADVEELEERRKDGSLAPLPRCQQDLKRPSVLFCFATIPTNHPTNQKEGRMEGRKGGGVQGVWDGAGEGFVTPAGIGGTIAASVAQKGANPSQLVCNLN